MERKKRVYHDYLFEHGIVPWSSKRTTYRKIKNEGFPAICTGKKGHEIVFDLDEVNAWFKSHGKKSA